MILSAGKRHKKFHCNMEAKKIDLNEWGYYGEGGTATSFCNKRDGNLYLKLNKSGYPEQLTREEFLASKLFGEMGLPTPPVYEYVTDGDRFGYTGERVKGKISFARILSQDLGRMEEIAGRFAAMAGNLHKTKADTSRMKSCLEHFTGYLGDMSFVPSDVADRIREYLKEFSDEPFCLHGDMNPGNVINFEGHDYWIGINSFMYGDPFWDMATMYIIANCMPAKAVRKLYHLSPSQYRKFFDAFGKHYFGDTWNSPQIRNRIRNAAKVKCCALIKKDPGNASLYVPFIRGNWFAFRLRLVFRSF